MKKPMGLENGMDDLSVFEAAFTAEQLAEWKAFAEAQGFAVEVDSSRSVLVPMANQPLLMCVDGRDDAEGVVVAQAGPKVQGGVYGIAALRAEAENAGIDDAALLATVQMLVAKGLVPGVHGDGHDPVLGCGFLKLWSQGKLEGLPPLLVAPEVAARIITDNGGKLVPLQGEHTEHQVRVNTVKGTTLNPDNTAFNLDLHVAPDFGIDPTRMLANAAQTVALLSPQTRGIVVYT